MAKDKIFKPVPPIGRPAQPLTEEQKREELIRVSKQKLNAITEGCIFNLMHQQGIMNTSPEEIVDFAFKVGQAYVEKNYGVSFQRKEVAEEEKK